MSVEAKYRVRLEGTGVYHYDVWLEEDGKRLGWGSATTGCSIKSHWRDRNLKDALRQAERDGRRLLREHQRKAESGEITGTVTTDGRPSYDALQGRIASLERELGIDTDGGAS